MHQRYLAISLAAAMLCAAPGWAAVIYKWTDADGVVHFSDQPTPGAERIVTQSGPVSRPAGSAVSSSPRTAARRQPTKTEPNATAVDYTEFEIQAPQPEQTFHDQTVNVRVRLEPELKPGHLLSLYLNGKLVEGQSPKSTDFTLTDLARGSYTLTASVMDAASGESKTTAPVTFYVQQPSLLSPLRRKK
ncbi:MAG: DUF4124 domain-containing protein [Proteobacteria bacterium]|nr:DUF4124 domain-containing protein [Pseudomonadota bacterium]